MMKKFYILMLSFLVFILSACSFNFNIEGSKFSPVEVDNGEIYETGDYLKNNGPLTKNALPSLGNVDVLVIPIVFSYTSETQQILEDIDTAFNGTKEETGYYSVAEYYKESSYGKLNFSFDIASAYTPTYSKTYYEKYEFTKGRHGSDIILEEALTFFDSSYDYQKYDSDKDGYIDAVWLIYTEEVDFLNGNFWWAYQTQSSSDLVFDGVEPLYYAFAGSDFMYVEQKYARYDTNGIIIDAHTYIHETGHLLGLDDYYDYDTNRGSNMSTDGYDMMDYNWGDHGPINKLLLGWINPRVVTKDYEGVIESYGQTGDVLLITDNFKGTIYDSYYLVIKYDETGIYEREPYFKNKSGLLVYQVNAQINYDIYNQVEYNGGSYLTGFKYDNSDTNKPFVSLLSKNNILNKYLVNNEKVTVSNYFDLEYHNGELKINFLND